MNFFKRIFGGSPKSRPIGPVTPQPDAIVTQAVSPSSSLLTTKSLELPQEFDGKMSYRAMFQSLPPERLRVMCRALPIEQLDLNRPGRPPTAREMGRAVTQVFGVSIYAATKEVPRQFGDMLIPRLVAKITKYDGADLHLELCDLVKDFAVQLAAGERYREAAAVLSVLKSSSFWSAWPQAEICLFGSLYNVALGTQSRSDFVAALEAVRHIPASQLHEIGGEDVIKDLKQKIEKCGKSEYWKCPKCGGLLQKGAGAMFAQTMGVATCGGCGAKFSQSDVYGGKYDVEERKVEPLSGFRIIGSTAMWGDGHQITFNNEYTPTELNYILDGILFPVSSAMTKDECRQLVEGNFPAAFQFLLRSSQKLNLPRPQDSDGYSLTIKKLHLSYAVRNNVTFGEAVRVFHTTMGF